MRSKYNWASFGTCEGTENHFVESDVTYVVPVVHGHVKAVGGRLFCFWVRRSKQRLPSNDPQLRQGQDLGVGGKNENVSRDLLDCLQKVQFGLLIGQVNQLQVPFHLWAVRETQFEICVSFASICRGVRGVTHSVVCSEADWKVERDELQLQA